MSEPIDGIIKSVHQLARDVDLKHVNQTYIDEANRIRAERQTTAQAAEHKLHQVEHEMKALKQEIESLKIAAASLEKQLQDCPRGRGK